MVKYGWLLFLCVSADFSEEKNVKPHPDDLIYRTWETDRPWIMPKGSSETTDPQDGLKYTVKFERYVKALKFDHDDFFINMEFFHFYYR